MATPQSVIHGTSRVPAALMPAAFLALVMLLAWELPEVASRSGGIAFLGAWSVALLLLGLPLVMLELMMGRRSRRSPLDGLAHLTREADARRGWRFGAWGGAGAVLLALAAIALQAGGFVNFLVRELGIAGAAISAASDTGPALPLGTGALLLVAAGFSLLNPRLRSRLQLAGLAVVILLLLLAATGGVGAAEALYPSRALTAGDWREAFRLALLSLGGGLGVLWLAGMRLPAGAPIGRLALAMTGLQVVFAVLLMLAQAPFVAAEAANAGAEAFRIVVTGPIVWIVLGALLLATALALPQIAEPLLLRLAERGMGRLPAVVLVFVAAALLAEGVWLVGHAAGLKALLTTLSLLLLAVLACLSVFAGWGMKISHARKELALPAEGVYNLWRVAVRLVVPLAIAWVLVQPFV
jgi:SNF family Na+-dependent transporter